MTNSTLHAVHDDDLVELLQKLELKDFMHCFLKAAIFEWHATRSTIAVLGRDPG